MTSDHENMDVDMKIRRIGYLLFELLRKVAILLMDTAHLHNYRFLQKRSMVPKWHHSEY
jgi:hypothetical protein